MDTRHKQAFARIIKQIKDRKRMEIIFEDKALEEIYETGTTKDSRYKKLCRDVSFISAYKNVVSTLYSVASTAELKNFSFLHYENLKYQLNGKSSVRIKNGRVERLIFTEHEDGILIKLIEIDNTHYANKK